MFSLKAVAEKSIIKNPCVKSGLLLHIDKNNLPMILSSAQCNYEDVQTNELEEKREKKLFLLSVLLYY